MAPSTQIVAVVVPNAGRNHDFFGRTGELTYLNSQLLPSETHSSLTHLMISGMGGVGKTELAIEWFCRNSYLFSAAFWIDASGPVELASGYDKIASALGYETEGNNENPDARRRFATDWFANAETPWLLCFDDVCDFESLHGYLPSGGTGSILFTCRNINAKPHHAPTVLEQLKLKPFSERDAAEFVRKATGCDSTDLEEQASLQVAREVGGLPLAIEHMASVFCSRNVPLEQLVEEYEAEYPRWRKEDKTARLGRYDKELLGAWDLEDISDDGLRLLRLLSFLGPAPVRKALLIKHPGVVQSSALQFEDRKGFKSAQAALPNSLTIENDWQGRLCVHPVILREVRVRMTVKEQHEYLSAAADILYATWEAPSECDERHQEELPVHLEHVFMLYELYKANWKGLKSTVNMMKLFQKAGA